MKVYFKMHHLGIDFSHGSVNPGESVAQAANVRKTKIEYKIIQAESYRLCTM